MATRSGLGLNSSGLVFGYDIGEHYYYPGEPTTNIVPSPENNARFTTSNSWATYNTNQYNGAQYFSIGTISSIASNIVTTTSAHPLRSFDVVTPQSTGGGVSNGTNYVVKKISSTSFSLHLYNGSENGSQGYINPTTNFYKVHDAWAQDTRISISSESFPTMWWGPPHLPNSGLIKEIVTNKGIVPGTNCMRWHIYRGDGVADGMAYGVYPSVTAGDVITVSYYLRAASHSAVGKGGFYTTYFGGAGAFQAGYSWGAYGEWVRNVHQWTASTTFGFYSYFFCDGASVPYDVDLADFQVEVNRGHATYFTPSSRSVTQALKDVKNVSTINVTNASYNSNAILIFDGTDDRLLIPNNSNVNISGNITIEFVIKKTSGQGVVVHKEVQYTVLVNSDGSISYADSSLWSYASFGNHGSAITNGVYHHVVVVKNGTNVTIYVNNNIIVSKTHGSSLSTTTNDLYIGSYAGSSNYFNGEIRAVRLYNRNLSADEVFENFKAYKIRFGI